MVMVMIGHGPSVGDIASHNAADLHGWKAQSHSDQPSLLRDDLD